MFGFVCALLKTTYVRKLTKVARPLSARGVHLRSVVGRETHKRIRRYTVCLEQTAHAADGGIDLSDRSPVILFVDSHVGVRRARLRRCHVRYVHTVEADHGEERARCRDAPPQELCRMRRRGGEEESRRKDTVVGIHMITL